MTAEALHLMPSPSSASSRAAGPAAPAVAASVSLLAAAGDSLTEAHWATSLRQRYQRTRLAALRAAAAVLAVRGGPRRGAGPAAVWELLPRVAPELTEWARYFAVALPEELPGEPGPASVRVVDDLLRDGEEFARVVAGLLGLPPVQVTADMAVIHAVPARGRRQGRAG